ncbi:MAG: outer membrane beta-barrel protein, partial [Bacteroidetes bacterium]|nr:outer membrane beta-barrel protein [Bacteroidota bacterium]
MNRFIPVFISLGLFFCYSSKAQEFTFGPTLGFNSSHMTTNQDSLMDEFRQGFEGGIFFRFYGDYLYAQPEILYVTKGGIFNTENESFKEEIDIQSVDIPVIFGLKLGPEEFNFRLFGGPVASLVVKKNVELSGNGMTSAV